MLFHELLWCPVCSPQNQRSMKLEKFEVDEDIAWCTECGLMGDVSILRRKTSYLWRKPMPRDVGVFHENNI